MPDLNEGKHPGEFIVSEANGDRSRESITLNAGQNLKGGHVLGKITASGEYKEYNPANADGSQTAAAILYENTDASAGAKKATIIARDAEVNRAELGWFSGATAAQGATGEGQLAAVGVIAR